jgi:peroxiredoxin
MSDARARRPGKAAIALAVVAAAAVAAALAWMRAHPTPAEGRAAGEELYSLSLADADGHAQSLSQWRGMFLVVNFWATWCTPCVAEMPELEKTQREFADRRVAIVGIGTEDLSKVRQFRDKMGLHMVLLAGGFDALSLARDFGDVQGVLPYTALFSPEGQLLRAHTGALRPGELRDWLAAAQ